MKVINIDSNKLKELILNKKTEVEIAKFFNVSVSYIRKYKSENNLLSRQLGLPGSTAQAKPIDEILLKELLSSSISIKEIATKLDVSGSKLLRYMKKYNLSRVEKVTDTSNYHTILGFSKYKINHEGIVINSNNEILSQFKSKGYPQVCILSDDNKQHNRPIHRLICDLFVPNPNNHPIINHIDGDKTNYDISNLEWCTYSHNSKHAYDTGLSTPKKSLDTHTCKLTEDEVKNIKKLLSENLSAPDIIKQLELKITDATIHKIKNNKTWKQV